MAAPAAPAPHAETLLSTIRQRVEFARNNGALGQNAATMMDQQVGALCVMLRGERHCTIEVGNAIASVLPPLGLSPDHNAKLASAISDAVAASIQPTRGTRCMQYCNGIHNYLTEADWEHLENHEVTIPPKCEIIGNRLWRLGITCPSPQLLKRCLALILTVGVPADSAPLTAELRKTYCKLIQSKVKTLDAASRWPGAHHRDYPDNPGALPPATLQFAYGETPPVHAPNGFDFTFYEQAFGSMGYRGTHSSLRPTAVLSLRVACQVDPGVRQLRWS